MGSLVLHVTKGKEKVARKTHSYRKNRLERWLRREENLLLLQRTGLQFPAPTAGGSQPPVTTQLQEIPYALLAIVGTQTHIHISKE